MQASQETLRATHVALTVFNTLRISSQLLPPGACFQTITIANNSFFTSLGFSKPGNRGQGSLDFFPRSFPSCHPAFLHNHSFLFMSGGITFSIQAGASQLVSLPLGPNNCQSVLYLTPSQFASSKFMANIYSFWVMFDKYLKNFSNQN